MMKLHPSASPMVSKECAHKAAYFDPIGIIDLWKENPLGLLRSNFLVSGC